ncbi:hypothetical protein QQZ08_012556, partial [Neonectria magnoliae]
MLSDYQLFGSGFLPLLAFDESMVKDLSSVSQNRDRAFVPQLNRPALLRAWEANKQHLQAISNPQALTNYGIRKEVTFRLDTILAMWSNGSFCPDRSPYTGSLTHVVPLNPEPGEHYPFWAVPTKDINALIFTQAARLVLPLDHIFLKPLPSQAPSSPPPVQQVLDFYTAQLLCRLLTHTLSSEQALGFDKWIWLSRWRVRTRDGCKERRGLGLDASINASGMLWIPQAHMNWQQGHLALETLINLYIPRNPLQARLAHQSNVQALTTSQVTVEFLLQKWLQRARLAFDEGRDREAEQLADRAMKLATEEIARAYHEHFLAKVESYWDGVRGRLGRSKTPSLCRLRRAQDESAADAGCIPTAQTIWEVYVEAWSTYTAAAPAPTGETTGQAAAEGDGHVLPSELPCWMTTRRRRPPCNSWCDFVFDHLFGRPSPPTWARLRFLQVYHAFKELWKVIDEPAGPFDDRFKSQIGRYVLVTFNSDQTKEVGTKHAHGTWYHGRPAFFQIQYWAPYFSPPEIDRCTRLSTVFRYEEYPSGLCPTMLPRIPSARAFQDLEMRAQVDWLRLMVHTEKLQHTADEAIQRYCRRLLKRMVSLVGPVWSNGPDPRYVVPWAFEDILLRGYGEEDVLFLPVSEMNIPQARAETV